MIIYHRILKPTFLSSPMSVLKSCECRAVLLMQIAVMKYVSQLFALLNTMNIPAKHVKAFQYKSIWKKWVFTRTKPTNINASARTHKEKEKNHFVAVIKYFDVKTRWRRTISREINMVRLSFVSLVEFALNLRANGCAKIYIHT